MKQLLFEIYNEDSLRSAIEDVENYNSYHSPRGVLFHLYCGLVDEDWICKITGEIRKAFPDAGIAGTASHAEIINGHLTDPVILLSAMIFETTAITVTCFEDVLGNEAEYGRKIREIVDATEDIRAAEILVRDQSGGAFSPGSAGR